jgi:hypothetical protein
MDRLGYSNNDGAGGFIEYIEGVPTNTFTFESPRIM